MVIYGAAGLGVAAFTPSLMSLVGDVAAPGTVARAYAWYTTALYAGFGAGPILGGWVTQTSGYRAAFVVAGLLIVAALATAMLPHLSRQGEFVLLAAALGAAFAATFVAVGAALSEATTPATRGLAMGGYSTAIYVGMGLASVGLGPVMGHWGYDKGFALAGAAGVLGTLVTAAVWGRPRPPR